MKSCTERDKRNETSSSCVNKHANCVYGPTSLTWCTAQRAHLEPVTWNPHIPNCVAYGAHVQPSATDIVNGFNSGHLTPGTANGTYLHPSATNPSEMSAMHPTVYPPAFMQGMMPLANVRTGENLIPLSQRYRQSTNLGLETIKKIIDNDHYYPFVQQRLMSIRHTMLNQNEQIEKIVTMVKEYSKERSRLEYDHEFLNYWQSWLRVVWNDIWSTGYYNLDTSKLEKELIMGMQAAAMCGTIEILSSACEGSQDTIMMELRRDFDQEILQSRDPWSLEKQTFHPSQYYSKVNREFLAQQVRDFVILLKSGMTMYGAVSETRYHTKTIHEDFGTGGGQEVVDGKHFYVPLYVDSRSTEFGMQIMNVETALKFNLFLLVDSSLGALRENMSKMIQEMVLFIQNFANEFAPDSSFSDIVKMMLGDEEEHGDSIAQFLSKEFMQETLKVQILDDDLRVVQDMVLQGSLYHLSLFFSNVYVDEDTGDIRFHERDNGIDNSDKLLSDLLQVYARIGTLRSQTVTQNEQDPLFAPDFNSVNTAEDHERELDLIQTRVEEVFFGRTMLYKSAFVRDYHWKSFMKYANIQQNGLAGFKTFFEQKQADMNRAREEEMETHRLEIETQRLEMETKERLDAEAAMSADVAQKQELDANVTTSTDVAQKQELDANVTTSLKMQETGRLNMEKRKRIKDGLKSVQMNKVHVAPPSTHLMYKKNTKAAFLHSTGISTTGKGEKLRAEEMLRQRLEELERQEAIKMEAIQDSQYEAMKRRKNRKRKKAQELEYGYEPYDKHILWDAFFDSCMFSISKFVGLYLILKFVEKKIDLEYYAQKNQFVAVFSKIHIPENVEQKCEILGRRLGSSLGRKIAERLQKWNWQEKIYDRLKRMTDEDVQSVNGLFSVSRAQEVFGFILLAFKNKSRNQDEEKDEEKDEEDEDEEEDEEDEDEEEDEEDEDEEEDEEETLPVALTLTEDANISQDDLIAKCLDARNLVDRFKTDDEELMNLKAEMSKWSERIKSGENEVTWDEAAQFFEFCSTLYILINPDYQSA